MRWQVLVLLVVCWRVAAVPPVTSITDSRWIKSQNIEWRVPSNLVLVAEVEQNDDDRDLRTSPKHFGAPSQLAVSPDGRWFATGLGKDVYTWKQPACVVDPEAASCEVERNFLQHFVLSSSLTFLGVPDDMHVAVVTEDDFSIWKFNESVGPVKSLDFPGVLAVAFEDCYILLGSPGGTFHMLKCAYDYGNLHAKRYENLEGVPKLLWSYSLSHALGDNGVPGRYDITAVALCKGDFWFAVAAWDSVALTGITLLWNLQWDESPKDMAASGPHGVARFYSDISPVRSMAFSPSKTLMIKGSDSGTITFWRFLRTTSDPVAERAVPWPVSSLEFSADGHWIVASNPSKGSARLYNTNPEDTQDSTAAATSFNLASSSSMALSADMGWLLVPSTLHRVQAWPLELRRPFASFKFADTSNGIRDLLLSPTEQFLLTGALMGNTSTPPSVALWAVSYMDGAMRPLLTLPLKGTFCCMLRVPDSDEEVLIGSRTSTQGQYNAEIYRWFVPWVNEASPRKAMLQASYTLPDCELLSFACTKSSALIAGCTSKVIVVQLDSPSALRIVKSVHLPPLVEASSLLTIGEGHFAFGSSKGNVCVESIHHSVKLEDSRCFNLGGRINTLQLSDDATELYSGSSSGGICRLSLKNFERKDGSCFTQPGATPDNEILSIALLDRNRLASSSASGVLALWDLDDIGRFEPMQPLMIQQTHNYQARMVVSRDLTYFYVTGTLGVVEAYFVNSMTTSLQRLKNSSLCREGGDSCSSSWIRAHTDLSVTIPSFLDNLPLQWLALQSTTLDDMGERPPVSMRKVNLFGAILRDWRAMKDGWWSIPSVMDVTNTNFVWIPVLHGEAMRLVTDTNCIHAAQIKEPHHHMTFCILRAHQHHDQLCATHFTSHDMNTDALAARVMGASLPILTQIYVDLDDFKAWLCDCPAGTFGPNGSYCETCPLNHYCPQAGKENEAKNLHPQPCPPNTGTTITGLKSVSECQCLPGFYQQPSSLSGTVSTSGSGSVLCKLCPSHRTSGYGSRQCHSCFFGYRPAGRDRGYASHVIGDCIPDWFGLAFFAVLQVAMIQIGLMYWLVVTGLPINDVSKQNGRWVVSTCGWQALWILPWLKKAYPVRFRKTGNPGLDQHLWDVKTITGIGQRFVLLRRMDDPRSPRCIIRDSQDSLETGDLWSDDLTLDTSQGFLHIQSQWALLCVGRIPEGVKLLILLLLPWPFWIKAFHKKDWLVLGLAISSAFSVIVLVLASLLLAPRPAIQANLSNFRHFFGAPRALDTTERSVEVANIQNLLVQFQFFIGSRDAYYVNSNILLPLTQSHCLSFAEMIGPSITEHGNYFVSHWWGAPFEKSMQSICKHAQLAQGSRWKGATYWCSLFSVNQWRVEEELGRGDLARSSFYLALTDSKTRATLLLLDDEAGSLTRSWCLFEVLQTCLLSQRRQETFEGLLLCTPSGVMNKAGCTASIDIAIATAERLVHLQFEAAKATNAADKEMIDTLVELYPGKLPAMNTLVQHHIREALSFIKEKHNSTFVKLLNELERGSGTSPGATGHGPRLNSLPVEQPSLRWHAAEDGIDAANTGWFSWLPSTDLFGWSGSMDEDSGDSEHTFSDSASTSSDTGPDECRGSVRC